MRSVYPFQVIRLICSLILGLRVSITLFDIPIPLTVVRYKVVFLKILRETEALIVKIIVYTSRITAPTQSSYYLFILNLIILFLSVIRENIISFNGLLGVVILLEA